MPARTSSLRLAAHAETRRDPAARAVFRPDDLTIGCRLEWRGLTATLPLQTFEVIAIERRDGRMSYRPGAAVEHPYDRVLLRDLADPDVTHSIQARQAAISAGWWLA